MSRFKSPRFKSLRARKANRRSHRRLGLQPLEDRRLLAGDMDDQISEAIPIPFGSTTVAQIDSFDDVDMYSIFLFGGETIGIDIDSIDFELDSGLAVFDSAGNQLLEEDDLRGPGVEYSEFESFGVFTAPVAGQYFIAVSTYDNFDYDPVTGTGDAGGETTGAYELIVDSAPDVYSFVVNTTGDLPDANPGDGLAEDANGNTSLRAAIEEANAVGGDTSIVEVDFNIDSAEIDPTTGRFVTSPLTPLPAIEQPVDIYTSDLFAMSSPPFQIDGSLVAGAATDGLRITGDGVRVSGFVVADFPGDGVDITGATAASFSGGLIYDNGGNGVRVVNSEGIEISFNSIFDNASSGVQISGASSNNALVLNVIGIDPTNFGAPPVAGPNGSHGIYLLSPDNILVDNTVAANAGVGINIATPAASGNLLTGNRVGIDQSGGSFGNGSHGVLIRSSDNVVGGTDVFSRNVISGNTQSGIAISGAGATDNVVLGNFLGTDINGTTAIANGAYGVLIRDASDNTIGGPNPGDMNVISGNGGSGVTLSVGAADNTIQGNYIGVNESGTAAIGNSAVGVYVRGGSNGNLIDDNIIAGNTGSQVALVGLTSTDNVLTGNRIGFGDDTGTIVGGNTAVLIQAPENTVGGTLPEDANLITGSATATGIVLSGVSARDNVILGNAIGTNDLTDGGNFGMRTGIRLTQGARDNVIGPANTIAFNTDDAIWATGSAGEGNTFTQNRMYENGFGIDLGAGGLNTNDNNDPDSGPNRLQNSAESLIVDASFNAAGLLDINFDYFVNSAPANAAYPLTVEFFTAAGNQGDVLIGSDTFTVADFLAGGKTITDVLDPADFLLIPESGTATVTDADGNTSEFSAPVPIDYDFAAASSALMTNPVNAVDVNGIGGVTPLDALLVLNALAENAAASGESSPQASFMVDTNGDGAVTPGDALQVLNYLADEAAAEAASQSWQDDDEEETIDIRQWDLALVGVTDLF